MTKRSIPKLQDPRTWTKGTIAVKGNRNIAVQFIPRSKFRIAVDDEGDLYRYVTTERSWYTISHGLYTLYRREGHTRQWYTGREIPTLNSILNKLHHLEISLVSLTSATPKNEQEEIQEEVTAIVRRVGNVRNTRKIEGKKQVSFILPLRDSRGRINQGVFLCRSVASLDCFEERVEEVLGIRPHILYYGTIVQDLVQLFDGKINFMLDDLRLVWKEVRQTDKADRNHVTMYLERVAATAQDLIMKPYIRTAERVYDESQDTLVAFHSGDFKSALGLISRMGHSLRCKQIRRKINTTVLSELEPLQIRQGTSGIKTDLVQVHVHEILKELNKIDETGFEQPVRDDVKEILLKVLEDLRSPSIDLSEIREQVKRAEGIL